MDFGGKADGVTRPVKANTASEESETEGLGPGEDGTAGLPRQRAFVHPMAVFLTPKYRSLDLFEDLDEEEKRKRREVLLQLKWQRAGENFFRESCVVKGCLMGAGGALLGKEF